MWGVFKGEKMNINILRSVDYETKCYEGVTMQLRNMIQTQFRKCVKFHSATKNKKAQLEYDIDLLFEYMVFDIKGLTLTDEKGIVTTIETGKDIMDNPGLDELVTELIPVLMEMEARVDPKN